MDKPSSPIRLYIDEDVHESVAPALRQHGYEQMRGQLRWLPPASA